MDAESGFMIVTFNMGVNPSADAEVMTYVDGEWIHAEDVKVRPDGSVTATFRQIGVVAICVDQKTDVPAPPTGDSAVGGLVIWSSMMMISGLLLLKRRQAAY
jgi:hypothetical protein